MVFYNPRFLRGGGMLLRAMVIQDYDAILALWKSLSNFYIRDIDDSKEGIEKFLSKNPNTSVVAIEDGGIVGSILCGYDGRSAHLYHVCVSEAYRNRRIGASMVSFCIEALRLEGATHINLIALKANKVGNLFWQELGFTNRSEANLYEISLI